jgi:hypothetical protein
MASTPERIQTLALALDQELSASIGKIRDLNERTHVLAINARIEAARAGVSGRGFRVVADAFGSVNAEIQEISAHISAESNQTLGELLSISQELAGTVRGNSLVQLADNVMDVVDRNLYERSCDVRWWATDPSVVRALEDPASAGVAADRLGTILDSYTVYADIVVVDRSGRVVANGRPGSYELAGADLGSQPWFVGGLSAPAGGFGFQSVHRGPLAAGEPVLVYSCPVRFGDRLLGVLAVVFRWEGLGRVLLDRLARTLDGHADLVLVDATGRVLARHGTSDFGDPAPWPGLDLGQLKRSGFVLDEVDRGRQLTAWGVSPRFETYASGWSCLIRQRL